MARTRGTKNHEGHKAGGARKGAGRKRKISTEPISEKEQPSQRCNPIIESSTIPDNCIDINQIHPTLKQHMGIPHHIPLVATTMPHPEASLESTTGFRLSYIAWDSTSSEERTELLHDIGSSLDPTTFDTQPSTFPASPGSRPFHPPLMPSQRSTSEVASHDVLQILPGMTNVARSQESLPQFERQQQPDAQVQDMSQSGGSTSSAAETQHSLPASPPAVTRPHFAYIAPASLSQQQRTWTFPYPLPTIMSSPFHRLAIVSQHSTNKRRRRRCAVCMRLGKEDASYDCPGRGDRSRCPYSRKRDEVCLPLKHGRTVDHEPKARETSNASGAKSRHSRSSLLQPFAPARPLSSVFIPDEYNPLTPYGQPAQQFVLSSGEMAKRRARRCMVCVARGKDGTSCPGRGSRTWCPDYDEALDARTIKWRSLCKEKEVPEPEPEKP